MPPPNSDTSAGALPQIEDDRTPYGQSPHFGPGVFLATCWWIVTASAHRISHLGLLRRSPNSQRFVFWVVGWLALAAAALQMGQSGWRTASQNVTEERAAPSRPSGRGWYHVAGDDRLHLSDGRARLMSVWWNPTIATLAAVQAFLLTIIAASLLLAWQRRAVNRALAPPFRHQGRLEAVLHYATAWWLLGVPAVLVAALAPLADVSVAARWSAAIPRAVIYGTAAVLALAALGGYSFWLLRAGSSVPTPTRARVVTFFGVWNPLIIVIVTVGLGLALRAWMTFLSTRLGLAW